MNDVQIKHPHSLCEVRIKALESNSPRHSSGKLHRSVVYYLKREGAPEARVVHRGDDIYLMASCYHCFGIGSHYTANTVYNGDERLPELSDFHFSLQKELRE